MRQRLAEQTGQALVILALGFVVMVAFVGLAADTLLVIVGQARLVRAADSAALAAASIYRENATVEQMKAMAVEFVSLNGADPASTMVATCEGDDPLGWYGGTLCPPGSDLRRKVLVRAQMPVGLAFLRILGFTTVTLTAESVGEAASLDVVLVIDRSESMANDTDLGPPGMTEPCETVFRDFDCDGIPDTDPKECNPVDKCEPFRTVKTSAIGFVDQLNETFDRVHVVFFDQEAKRQPAPPADLTAVKSVIDTRRVYTPPACFDYPPDPSACTSTNIGGALWQAACELAPLTGGCPANGRPDGLWVIILLTDGAANTTNTLGVGPHAWPNVYCPPSTWSGVFCRDPSKLTRHVGPDDPLFDFNQYDSDDWARDMADFAASNQIVIFTIGLGEILINNPAAVAAGGHPDGGEDLLRYIAAAGDDGRADTNPCEGEDPGIDCGNYYFAENAGFLDAVFREIADRILTRLVQ